MEKNIFPLKLKKNKNCNKNSANHLHSCPYCKCKSLDNLIKLSPKNHLEYSTKLQRDNLIPLGPNLSKDSLNLSLKPQSIQNIYQRPFNPNNRQSISPNLNQKVVIQYYSPAPKYPIVSANPISAPFIQQKNIFLPNDKISPTKMSPRTIYNSQNTPPKAKFLQKRIQKKKSLQKVPYQTPLLKMKFFQIQTKPLQTFQNKQQAKQQIYVPYEPFKFLSMSTTEKKISIQKSEQVLPSYKLDYFEGIFRTQTKNFIPQKLETPQSVGSPFNSLVDTTPNIIPYGSFSSTPIIPNDTSQKRQRQSSINVVGEFNQQGSEVKLNRNISQPVEIENYQFTPKQIEMPFQGFQNFQKINKNLAKNDNDQRIGTDNELIYSESDQKTIQNFGGSQKNIFENKSLKVDSNQTKSEKNMRLNENFEKKKNRYDLTELSDNFETPRSKFKGVKEPSKVIDSKKSIKFKVVGENKKSKISNCSRQSISQVVLGSSMKQEKQEKNVESKSVEAQSLESKTIENKSFENKFFEDESSQLRQSAKSHQLLKQQSFIKQKKESIKEIIMQDEGFDKDQGKEVSLRNDYQAKTIERDNSVGTSNQYNGQLTEELKLNYDYYMFQPTRKYSVKDPKDEARTKLPDSGNEYLPDSSASSHGLVNISF